MNKWSKRELDFLKANYKRLSYVNLAKRVKRSVQSIYWKAFEIGLKKGRWNESNRLSKEKIIDMLIAEKHKLGKSPSVREIPISLKSACQRHFGNFNNAKKAANLSVRNFVKFLPKKSLYPSKELAYIVGLLLGDGSFRYQKSKVRTSYVIVYATKDKELMDFFLNTFEKWSRFNLPKIYTIRAGYRTFPNGHTYHYQKAYYVQICSKSAWKFLKKFKDSPTMCLDFFPKNIQNWLLKGLWDAEGCISLNNSSYLRIHFSNSNQKIIILYKKLLKNFNLPFSTYKTQTGFNVDILKSQEKLRFVKLIEGITIKRKENKFLLVESKNAIKK